MPRGWRHQGDLGIEGREAFAPPADGAYHHLYVVVAGSQPHRDHVDLRDFLRAHPAQAGRYGELKHHLAGLLATDRLAYGEGKAELIAEFLHQARTRPGQSLPTGDSIRASPPPLTASMAHWAVRARPMAHRLTTD